MKRSRLYQSSVYLAVVWVTLLLLSVMNVNATVLSGPITNPMNGHLYYLLDTAAWTASEAEAITLGGHLVTINDVAENDWVFDTFVPLLPPNVPSVIWIGLSDAAQEGTFVWASGEPVTYTNWSPGQPDNARGVEDYAHIWTPMNIPQHPSAFRQWNDVSNDRFGGIPFGVVELENGPPPTAVGGAVTGFQPRRIQCINRTTGQSIVIRHMLGVTYWDCEAAGLVVNPGDRIHLEVNGVHLPD